MKDYTPAAWDKAIENVKRDYEQIVLMPLVGKKIGLALMFEDLVKQGAVKKYRVRTGEQIKLD
jgi:ferredoxin-fold anticodon binding domain-containing protein